MADKGGAMSGNKVDRRVRRTRDRLGDALVALMQEKPFDEIKVREVLDRAGVGRSTFYEHFKDKDDLLLSDADEFFEMMATLLARRGDTSKRVAPVRELFAHVADVQPFYQAMQASGLLQELVELGTDHFARGIEERLAARGAPLEERPVRAQALAGALFALLPWWIRRGRKESPAEMDELFHRMVD
jgi:AcrR family transcriptional regulator